jgi:hypothetical protein
MVESIAGLFKYVDDIDFSIHSVLPSTLYTSQLPLLTIVISDPSPSFRCLRPWSMKHKDASRIEEGVIMTMGE